MNSSTFDPRSLRLPESYELVRLGYVARLQNGLTVDAKRDITGDVVTRPYLRVANVQAGSLNLESVTEITVPRSVARRSTLRPGDVLMTEGGDLDKLGRGTVWRGELEECLHQNHIFAIRPDPRRLNGRFLAYLTQSLYGRCYFESTGTRTTNLASTNSSKIQSFPLPLPPLEEQKRIADYLDIEIARIDETVELRQKQLELLEDQDISTVLYFVGGQGEPTEERKPSGLDWIGDVPESWPVMPVAYQYEVLLGKMLSPERARGEHLRPYLRNVNVQWDAISTDDLLMMNFPPEERVRYRLRAGDLLICEGGEPGRCAIWNGAVDEIYYQKALHRVRARGYSSPRWLYYCMKAATSQNVFAVEGNATTIAHLTGEQLRAHRFPFPPRGTQDRITGILDEEANQTRDLRSKIDRQLDLLAEHRQVLITAAVTGQLDNNTAPQNAAA
ncbi:restriction endonuclease subunit S [Streptomyces sp. ISL-10]|uniref:restriction endonuclease subunit S n=1 Tax=Streptomyces sp. ISL-10 TaxID=2819172 RepID=UPI001BE571FB|nr:restriction endonuclease subunit S [Streptomyces sp. ISL-10]MBT2363884.1 restriction endonuclease subunit S [Streptomyces sp. ISL-10]